MGNIKGEIMEEIVRLMKEYVRNHSFLTHIYVSCDKNNIAIFFHMGTGCEVFYSVGDAEWFTIVQSFQRLKV